MNNPKILLGDKGNVDFSEPIKLSTEQQNEFIQFMKTIFEPVKTKTTPFRTKRLGEQKRFPRKWELEEYEILFQVKDEEYISNKLGRTHMSVLMRKGQFIGDFMYWTQQKNYDLFDDKNTLKFIKEFLKEKEDKIINRRETKKKERELKKEIEEIKEQIKNNQSDKRKKQLELLLKMGMLKESPEKTIQQEENRLKKELENKKQELKELENN